MRTQTAPTSTGHQPAPEELSWDRPTPFHAESRAPRDDEPARGFLLRLHSDPACPLRLVTDGLLALKTYERAKAETVCSYCGTEAVAASSSSVVRRLREAERALRRVQARAGDGPMPREVVHCRAIRFEAESAVSLHPAAPMLADRVAALASEVSELLREAMTAYDRRR